MRIPVDTPEQSLSDWMRNGTPEDRQTTYGDGSAREPGYRPGADQPKPRPLSPSPFNSAART